MYQSFIYTALTDSGGVISKTCCTKCTKSTYLLVRNNEKVSIVSYTAHDLASHFLWNSKGDKILKLKHIVKFIANAWAISTSPCIVKMSHKCMVNSKYYALSSSLRLSTTPE